MSTFGNWEYLDSLYAGFVYETSVWNYWVLGGVIGDLSLGLHAGPNCIHISVNYHIVYIRNSHPGV